MTASPRYRYEPTITLGNVLTIISLLVGFFGYIVLADRRVTIAEQILRDHERRIGGLEHAPRPSFFSP